MCRHELARSPGEEISRSWTTKVNNILRPAAGLQRDAAENKITTFSSPGAFFKGYRGRYLCGVVVLYFADKAKHELRLMDPVEL